MNEKVYTLCGRNHSASNCPHTRGSSSMRAWFVKSADGKLSEAKPGLTPGLTILAKSAPWLGLGEIAPSSGQGATVESGGIGDE